MEIKVGDKVKLKNGVIAKIININDFREPSMRYGAVVRLKWSLDNSPKRKKFDFWGIEERRC